MLKIHEKYAVLCALLFMAFVCYSTLYFLPADDHLLRVAVAHSHGEVHDHEDGDKSHVHVRDLEERRRHQVERDKSFLRARAENEVQMPPPIPKPDIGAGDDADGRRITVKQMTKFAWDSYKKYAWGSNELKPISKKGHSASIFGSGDLGATIVDALDTLYIMGLKEEYEDAHKWIEMNLDFKRLARGDISVFETNIRFVGGLLSGYALTRDEMYLKKATSIVDLLLPAFDTPTGIPLALINIVSGKAKNYGWASGGASILSEFGSLELEFDYLSNLTGNDIYRNKIKTVRDFLTSLEKPDGLYPIYLNPNNGKWGQREYSIGAMADSFYEYLLKQYLVTGKKDTRTKKEYNEAIEAMEKKMLFSSSPSNLKYFANLKGSRVEHKMEHLGCFCGGMFALDAFNEPNATRARHYMDLAKDIGHTCHESYRKSAIGIGPEAFRFTNDVEAVAVSSQEKYYILRPEVVETWFYLWRFTKDQKYRDWAWDVVQALEKHLKVEAGYSGVKDVYQVPVTHDDTQQSFLFAELFKYLYLIFSEDSVMDLTQWVFNTEAHPFPVRNS
ncbi:unnamed protein product, partial [Mesorhabditis belari]|uniref:alpha-1,2-Mannosidase n=1 Tax=Mesorhabditis belari TaxID=2138241 RepID=A0AAF3EYB2_9BILA